MDSERDREYVFDCPKCCESLTVNGSMRDALVDRGCVICGAPVSPEAFSRDPSTEFC